MDLLGNLNPVQQMIVKDTEGYMLILAGAGAGKTRVLTYRIAYLIQNGINPWNILAVTFTNKASKEMKQRVIQLVGSSGGDVWAGTFHSICVRILRRYAGEIGLQGFTIIDEKEKAKLIQQACHLCGFEYDSAPIIATISNAKNDLLSPMELLQIAEKKNEKEIAHIYQAYEDIKMQGIYMDFDDLIIKTVHILRYVEEARQIYQGQFRYVLTDEGQDTNTVQYALLNLLTEKNGNMTVVADIDQGIYKWRGALISNMIKFQQMYPTSRIHKLEQNYRSTSNIVEASNALISHNKERLEKISFTENPAGDPIILYRADDDGREADFVASAIRRIMQVDGRSYKDFAVLYRTGRQSRAIESALMQAGLKYQVIGSTSFYDRKEIKDLISYLRLMCNEFDALAMNRIINVPKRGIGDTTVKKIEDFAISCQIPFTKAIENLESVTTLSKGTKAKVEEFVSFINELRVYACQPDLSIASLIIEIMDRTGYRNQLDPDEDEDAGRLGNIDELINVADQWDKNKEEGKTLTDFLSETTLSSDIDSLEEEDTVFLMTLHAAKGLEFPIVFMIGMEENILPHGKSLSDPADIEEERRITYVGITRAEERLFWTYCKSRYEYGDPRPKMNKPSRFINELPQNVIKRIG